MGILTPPSPLGAAHQLDDFDCGNATLNDWLRRQARRNEASGASRTFVVCDAAGSVVGYYCLAAGAVAEPKQSGALYFSLARMADYCDDNKAGPLQGYERSLAALKTMKEPPEGAVPVVEGRIRELSKIWP